ncbi:MAG TPA: metal-dependent transcriptional regulator [Herpetosiphonaceae bacterium]|nr:metal-dependent transcriptional regulator [Herpetosiphonaceae bacterium]
MNLTAKMQDYAKAIYLLSHNERRVTNGQLAAYFGISAPAITEMLKKLAGQGLADYHPRAGVRLTAEGARVALTVLRHHRLIELYLVTALGMPWDAVHAEAEVLEHVLSSTLEARITAFLNDPQVDPYGAPIPARDGTVPQRPMHALATLTPGCAATVAAVDDRDAAILRYLASLGIVPNARLVVADQAPFDGPLSLDVGEQSVRRYLDARLATQVFVHPA